MTTKSQYEKEKEEGKEEKDEKERNKQQKACWFAKMLLLGQYIHQAYK